MGKPHPESFVKALAALNRGLADPVPPSQCLAVEDSKEGIRAARGAGMKCLAVANSYPAEALTMADAVVRSLAEVAVPDLERLLS
jgi:sugar-phosphatase